MDTREPIGKRNVTVTYDVSLSGFSTSRNPDQPIHYIPLYSEYNIVTKWMKKWTFQTVLDLNCNTRFCSPWPPFIKTLFTWSDNAKAEKELTSLERWMLLASHLRKWPGSLGQRGAAGFVKSGVKFLFCGHLNQIFCNTHMPPVTAIRV